MEAIRTAIPVAIDRLIFIFAVAIQGKIFFLNPVVFGRLDTKGRIGSSCQLKRDKPRFRVFSFSLKLPGFH